MLFKNEGSSTGEGPVSHTVRSGDLKEVDRGFLDDLINDGEKNLGIGGLAGASESTLHVGEAEVQVYMELGKCLFASGVEVSLVGIDMLSVKLSLEECVEGVVSASGGHHAGLPGKWGRLS